MGEPWELKEDEALLAIHVGAMADTELPSWALTARAAQQKLWRWLTAPDDDHGPVGGSWERADCDECRARVNRALTGGPH